MKYVIFTSGGNDSIALIQWAHEHGLKDVSVVYSNTGWGISWWSDRVKAVYDWVEGLEFEFEEIPSEGMKSLIRRKKAWPRGGGGKFQFCTHNLKEAPALEWLDSKDPEKEATCLIGIRRGESRNRRDFPEHTEESTKHGGRELWAPLVRHTEITRNVLLDATPFSPLPYRSKECYPCVNMNQGELKLLDEETICEIEDLETEMGVNSKGNPRVMFSPKRHNGAVGIRAVVNDAKKGTEDLLGSVICSSGWCGD